MRTLKIQSSKVGQSAKNLLCYKGSLKSYHPKVYGSEGHKNGANQILILCMFFSTSGHLVRWYLILASKLGELEQFENRAANGLFTYKIEFSGKWLCSRTKCKKGDPL